MRPIRTLSAILATLALASAASAADGGATPADGPAITAVVVEHRAAAGGPVEGATAPPAGAWALPARLIPHHAESKTAIGATKAGAVALPPGFQAQWDALVGRLPAAQDALAGMGRNHQPAGSSRCTVIVDGEVVYSGPGTSASATVSRTGGQEHRRVVIDGKEVAGF